MPESIVHVHTTSIRLLATSPSNPDLPQKLLPPPPPLFLDAPSPPFLRKGAIL